MSDWVEAAQVASGVAAIVAIAISIRAVRAANRTPLADSYVRAWESIVGVVVKVANLGPDPLPHADAEALLHEFRVADQRLAVLESALRVKVYDRSIRHQVNNLLIDALFNTDGTIVCEPFERGNDDWMVPAWADRDMWPQLGLSAAAQVLIANDVLWDRPTNRAAHRPGEYELLEWYSDRIFRALNTENNVYSSLASHQHQVSRLVLDFNSEFLEPWIRNATREALMGRRSWAGRKFLARKLLRRLELFRASRRSRQYLKARAQDQMSVTNDH